MKDADPHWLISSRVRGFKGERVRENVCVCVCRYYIYICKYIRRFHLATCSHKQTDEALTHTDHHCPAELLVLMGL